ncbi:Conserved_hypothetical protein [Hexamita inflata]|uniref:Uncharacterized protein n=1 Tax=Hexamita inflata TaxID=28002 RepID=A0AA86P1C9_9EUKA|nr:Conserved hypothetical protein [Hexamita inflata]
MFSVPNLFDYYPKDQPAVPSYKMSDIALDKPNRVLSTHEVKQNSRNLTIQDFGVCEEEFDFSRASQVINYLMKLYPFLSYGIKFDEDLKWIRYDQQAPQEYDIKEYDFHFKSLDEIGDHLTKAAHYLSGTKLTHWQFVKLSIPEWPTAKAAVVVTIYHTLVDGPAVMLLLKKFNQCYSNLDLRLDETPTPIQLSNFRPVMCYNEERGLQPVRVQAQKQYPFTKITGQFKDQQAGSNLKYLDEYGIICRHYKEEDFCRIRGVQYTFSLYAVQMVQFAGYAYFNKDVEANKPFLALAPDLRRYYDSFKLGKIPNLDLINEVIGQAAISIPLVSKGNLNTTLQELANQFQTQFENQKQSDEQFWQTIINSEMIPITSYLPLPCSILVSNIGKMDLDVGPIVHMIGQTTSAHVWNEPPAAFNCCINRGKLGIVLTEWDLKLFTKQQTEWNDTVYRRIHKLVIERGAENVFVKDVVQLFEEIWSKK